MKKLKVKKRPPKPSEWVWMPHAGHFICGNDCRFHLTTYVGVCIVSTVGELFPDSAVREIFADTRGIELVGMGDDRKYDYMQKIGFEDIGFERKYETMVFKAQKSKEICCPWEIIVSEELDMDGYNDAGSAMKGHYDLCQQWAEYKERK